MPLIEIFLETERLLVVDKPYAWLTTPARLSDDPRPCLGRELQSQLEYQIFPVHRLDFEVSGLTLWAKDAEAHRLSQKWFEESLIGKTYEAYSRPGHDPAPRTFLEWNSHLVRGKKRSFEAAHGKPSRTKAKVIEESESLWKWELQALTGRPHQLRFEMSKHGHALLGDTLYGGETWPVPNWLGLRAVALDLARIAVQDRLGLPRAYRGESAHPAGGRLSVLFYFVRHGQTEANRQQVLAGSGIDHSLSDEGHQQAKALAQTIGERIGHPPQRLLVSDLTRARQTADYLAQSLKLVPEVVPDFREWHFGDWEGKSFAEYSSLILGTGEPANGERRQVFYDRIDRAWRAQHSPTNPYVMVSHGAVWLALQDNLKNSTF